MKSGQQLMREARMRCLQEAEGEVTPVVIEKYGPQIDGETGFFVGHPEETESGRACIIWDHYPDKNNY